MLFLKNWGLNNYLCDLCNNINSTGFFMRNFLPAVVSLLFTCSVYAQNLPYARQVVDTLCSTYMSGRGYTNDGDRKAAAYIAAEYKRMNALSFGQDYYQHFNIDANVFKCNMSLSINRKLLTPGVDYLIHPASAGILGTYQVVQLKEKWLLNDKKFAQLLGNTYEGKVLYLNYKAKNAKDLQGKLGVLQSAVKAAAYITPEDKKLTWHISGQPKYQTEITILRKKAPRKLKTASVNIDNTYLTNYKTQNVAAYIRGTQYPDSFFVFTAHYDHLGQMGSNQYIPGANDNASGVAMLLNLMSYYTQNPPPFSVAFIAFSAEELGLMGSKYYTEHPLFPLKNIRFLVNLDIVGTGNEGITAVNATEFPDAFNLLRQLNDQHLYLPQIKSRGTAANSDHYWFYKNGVPCFFIYTMGGIQAYHDVFDRPETLPLTKFLELSSLLIHFANELDKQ